MGNNDTSHPYRPDILRYMDFFEWTVSGVIERFFFLNLHRIMDDNNNNNDDWFALSQLMIFSPNIYNATELT